MCGSEMFLVGCCPFSGGTRANQTCQDTLVLISSHVLRSPGGHRNEISSRSCYVDFILWYLFHSFYMLTLDIQLTHLKYVDVKWIHVFLCTCCSLFRQSQACGVWSVIHQSHTCRDRHAQIYFISLLHKNFLFSFSNEVYWIVFCCLVLCDSLWATESGLWRTE